MAAPEPRSVGAARRLARNALVPMLAGIVSKTVDLAFAMVYLRLLEPAGAGALQFLVVLTTYLDTLINFGFNTVVARDVSRDPTLAAAAFRTVSILRVGLWALGLPLVALVTGPLREPLQLPPEATAAGWLFYLALLPSSAGSTATGLLWAAERLDRAAMVSVGATVLKVVLGTVALVAGTGLVGLGGVSVVVSLASAVLLLAAVPDAWRGGQASGGMGQSRVQEGRRGTSPRTTDEAEPAFGTAGLSPGSASSVVAPRALLRESWPLFLNQLLAGLFFKVDSLLLQGLGGSVQAGLYAAAYKVVDGSLVVPSSVTLALFPRLSRHALGDAAGLGRAYRLTLRTLLQLAVPLAAGTALLAGPLVSLLGGRQYLPESALALVVLAWFMPLSFANGLTQYALIALGRQRFLTGVYAAATVFNVAANLILIPRLGYLAAALTTILSELVLLVPFMRAVRPAVGGLSLPRELVHPVAATLLMAPVVWWLRDAVHPLAAIAAGLLVYPAALWAVGGVDEEQRRLVGDLLPGRLRSLVDRPRA